MFDNGSLLRRRKRFKTVAKQRSVELERAQNNKEMKSQSTQLVEHGCNFSDFEAEYSESDDESQNNSKVDEKQAHFHKKETPNEPNEIDLISNNLINSPIMVNIPNSNDSLSSPSSNLNRNSPTKQLTPQHASSPNDNHSQKNSSLFSIDCLIGESSTYKNHLGIQSHVIKKVQKPTKRKLTKKLFTCPKDSSMYNINRIKSNTNYSTSVGSDSRIQSRSSNGSNSRSVSPEVDFESTPKYSKSINSFVTPNSMLNMFQNPNFLNDPQSLAAIRIRNSLTFLYSPLTNGGLPLECSPTSSSLISTPESHPTPKLQNFMTKN